MKKVLALFTASLIMVACSQSHQDANQAQASQAVNVTSSQPVEQQSASGVISNSSETPQN